MGESQRARAIKKEVRGYEEGFLEDDSAIESSSDEEEGLRPMGGGERRHTMGPPRGCKLPADTRPRHEMLHFHYVRVLRTHGDHPSTSKAQKYFFHHLPAESGAPAQRVRSVPRDAPREPDPPDRPS